MFFYVNLKVPGSSNCKKLVSAVRVKKGGICFEGAQATKKLVSWLSLAVQSMYPKRPLPPPHLYPQGANLNQDSIQSLFIFSLYTPLVGTCLYVYSYMPPVGTDAKAAGVPGTSPIPF
jgi:hypothetical protein